MHDLSHTVVPMSEKPDIGKCLYGTVTVGERGQIVIPADARRDLGLNSGDKLIIMKDPRCDGLMIGKLESIIGFFESFMQRLKTVEPAESEDER